MHTLDAGTQPLPDQATLRMRQQVVLATYWFSLSFHAGALLGIAVPAQLSTLASDARATTLLALLGGVSGLLTMVVQPVAGALSDLSSSSWGRRRPYLIGGALLDMLGLLIMAIGATLPLLCGGFLLASFGNAVSGAAYQAYIPDRVPAHQYGEASGYLGVMSMIGTIASFGVAAVLVAPRQVAPFYLATLLVIALGAALTAAAVPDPPAGRAAQPRALTWRALWLEPWRQPDFAWVFATRSMMMTALYTLFTFVAFYVRDVVHIDQFVQGAAAVAAVATFAALGGGVVAGILSDRTGRKPLVSASSTLMAAALLGLAFFHNIHVVLGLGLIFGLALGAYMAVDWALAVDVLPDEGFAAKDLGLWGISTSLPQTIAPLLGGGVLATLSPFGADVSYGTLFVCAGILAGASGLLIWRVRGVR